MQANSNIQNAIINTNAAAQAALVAGAMNVHRTYLRDQRPVSKRPVGVSPFSEPGCTGDLKQESLSTGSETGTGPQSRYSGPTWRLDTRHLPEAAWAMLVLNRSMCG
jgi:hypothetical protein